MSDLKPGNAPEIPDGTPTYVDDNPNPAPAAPPIEEAAAPAEPAPEPREPTLRPDPRTAIAENRKAMHNEDRPFEGMADLYTPPFVQVVDEPEPEQEAAPEPPQPQQAASFKLKVRGNEITASRDELIRYAELEPEEAEGLPEAALVRLAQKQLAASSYLDEVKQASKDARTAARAPGDTPPANAAPEPDEIGVEGEESPPQDDRDPFEIAIEKVQFGEPAEAAQALREALTSQERTRLAQEAEKRAADEIATQIHDFEQANADLVGDPDLGGILYNRYVYEEMIKDVATEGAKRGLSEAQIRESFPNVGAALQAYTLGRAKGFFRAPNEILSSSAQSVRTKFNRTPATPQNPAAPAPAPVSDRAALKRALPPQPSRSAAPLPAPPPAAPPSRSAAVMKLRAGRPGQAPR